MRQQQGRCLLSDDRGRTTHFPTPVLDEWLHVVEVQAMPGYIPGSQSGRPNGKREQRALLANLEALLTGIGSFFVGNDDEELVFTVGGHGADSAGGSGAFHVGGSETTETDASPSSTLPISNRMKQKPFAQRKTHIGLGDYRRHRILITFTTKVGSWIPMDRSAQAEMGLFRPSD